MTQTSPSPAPHPLFEARRDPSRFLGAAVSLLFHAVLLVLIIRGAVDEFIHTPAAGSLSLPPGGGGGGGGGGQRLRYISLPPAWLAAV